MSIPVVGALFLGIFLVVLCLALVDRSRYLRRRRAAGDDPAALAEVSRWWQAAFDRRSRVVGIATIVVLFAMTVVLCVATVVAIAIR